MSFIDRFLDVIRMKDDDDIDDEFLNGEDDYDEEDMEEEEDVKKPSRFARLFKPKDDDDLDDIDDYDDFDDEPETVSRPSDALAAEPEEKKGIFGGKQKKTKERTPKKSERKTSKITPIRRKSSGDLPMEVNVIRPTSMEDTKDIADTLMDSCTVILNLEGMEVDIAQRIFDFSCGACYSLNGSLKKVSNYIFILTPDGVDISGDVESMLTGSFDLPNMKSRF